MNARALHTTRPRSNHTLASEVKEQGGRGEMGRQGDSLGLLGCGGTSFPGLGPPSLTACRGIRKQGTRPHSQDSSEGLTLIKGPVHPLHQQAHVHTGTHAIPTLSRSPDAYTSPSSCSTAQNLRETQQLHNVSSTVKGCGHREKVVLRLPKLRLQTVGTLCPG